jgi:hypothetical protein
LTGASHPLFKDDAMSNVRIERATNGFIIHARDPVIAKSNEKSKGVYKDPDVDILCKTSAEVQSWLKKNLDKALPVGTSYDTAFAAASVEDDDYE